MFGRKLLADDISVATMPEESLAHPTQMDQSLR